MPSHKILEIRMSQDILYELNKLKIINCLVLWQNTAYITLLNIHGIPMIMGKS